MEQAQTHAEEINAEEQAGSEQGEAPQNLYHVFTDFKKAFDRVWHAASLAFMRNCTKSNANLDRAIEHLYDRAISAV